MSVPPDSGFVYVATGPAYVAEALVAVASLRAAMPGAPVALVTDAPLPEGHAREFDHVIVRPDVQRLPIDKLLAWEAPFDRCIFLDTDTHVAGDLGGLFDILDSFDVAAAPETLRGWHYQLPGVPHAFPEFNTGVIAFRRSPAAADFFDEWRSRHVELSAREGFTADQPAFRWAAFTSQARIAALPSEFHFIAQTPNCVMWDVRLIHGRGNLPATLRRLNVRLGTRAYVPGLGPIEPFLGRFHWLTQGLRLLARGLLLLVRPPRTEAQRANRDWLAQEAARRTPPSRGSNS